MSNFSDLIPFFTSISSNFPEPNFFLEQYTTTLDILESYYDFFPTSPSNLVIDLGIGTGILSFLAIKRGSKSIIGIDIDRRVLQVAKKNASILNIQNLSLIHSSVEFFNFEKFLNKVNGIIMNPPFGTKRKYLDFVFLLKAMRTRAWILTLHKDNSESEKKLSELCKKQDYSIDKRKKLTYNLPNTHKIHKMNIYPVKVSLYLLIPNV